MAKTKDEVGEEAMVALRPLKRAGAAITTGGGKTKIGLTHMNENYNEFAKFLVVGPKLEVNNVWKEEAEKFGFAHLIPHFDFTTYLSLDKMNLNDYDVIYLDECHSLKYSHEACLSGYKGIIIGLTGTPPKYEKSEKGKMVSKFCPIVYKYITDDAVSDKILNDYEIIVYYVDLNPIRNIPMHKNGKTWFTSEKDTYDFWTRKIDESMGGKALQMARIMRMKSLMGFPSKDIKAKQLLASIDKKVLLFANTHLQADDLCDHSFHAGNPLSQQNLADFKSGKIMKMSCVHQLSEGINVPNLEEILLMHAYSNERKSAQRIGRGLRLDITKKATIRVLCYRNTVDERWVKEALADFDQSKIRWI